MQDLGELFIYMRKRNDFSLLKYLKDQPEYIHTPRIVESQGYINLMKDCNIDLYGLTILELGPGAGTFLEVAKNERSKSIEFIDYNPYIYTYNKLCGFNGYVRDFYSLKAFNGIPTNRYDLIITRGAINLNRFDRQIKKSMHWIKQLEQLLRSDGRIIICPTYDLGDDDTHPYLCNIDIIKNSKIFKYLMDNGYKCLPFIKGFSHKDFFPFTFYKQKEGIV